MTVRLIRAIFGIGLICAHFGAIIYTFSLSRDRLETRDALAIALIITPIFSVHTLAALNYFVRTAANRRRTPRASLEAVIVSFLIPFGLIVFIYGSLYLYSVGSVATPELLKELIGATETLFGAYLGILSEWLFPTKPDVAHQQPPG
jgi:hypothetical protein